MDLKQQNLDFKEQRKNGAQILVYLPFMSNFVLNVFCANKS